eukprot:11849709-Prorocentrum_lima.AAC.1
MTSSLVGSEMCIRDSRNARGDGGKMEPALSAQAEGCQEGLLWLLRRLRTCLLYTSDAADDM